MSFEDRKSYRASKISANSKQSRKTSQGLVLRGKGFQHEKIRMGHIDPKTQEDPNLAKFHLDPKAAAEAQEKEENEKNKSGLEGNDKDGYTSRDVEKVRKEIRKELEAALKKDLKGVAKEKERLNNEMERLKRQEAEVKHLKDHASKYRSAMKELDKLKRSNVEMHTKANVAKTEAVKAKEKADEVT